MSVEGKNFTDRELETTRLQLNFENGMNSILISPRRIGKTSLVKKVKSLTEGKERIVVFMDIYKCRTEYDFYEKFASDSLFQIQSMNEPVSTVLPDPDDDYSTIEGEFYPEQWPDFKPLDFPSDMIYNILYGQQYRKSRQKLFVLRGISNGLEAEMTFKQIDGRWKLVKLIN